MQRSVIPSFSSQICFTSSGLDRSFCLISGSLSLAAQRRQYSLLYFFHSGAYSLNVVHMSSNTNTRLTTAKAAAMILLLKSLTSFSAMRHSFPTHDLSLIADPSPMLAQGYFSRQHSNIQVNSWDGEDIFDVEKQTQNHLDRNTNHAQ